MTAWNHIAHISLVGSGTEQLLRNSTATSAEKMHMNEA